ncbi:MAG: hypothetical protein ACRD17_14755 [Terriglobales bacterium]
MIARLSLISAVLALLALLPGRLYAQFKWVNFTTLSGDLPNGQVGLTALNGELIMTWGAQGSNELMFSTSTDGVHWTTPQGLSGTVHADNISQDGPPYASGGVNMTTSPVCNAAYVAWTDPDGNDIYVAATHDGQNWTYAGPLASVPSPSGYNSPGTSSPALYGGNSQPIIQFAYPVPYGMVSQPDGDGGSAATESYNISVGQFDCDLSGVQLEGDSSCFFWDSGNNTCQDNVDSYYPNAYEWDGGYIQTLTPSGPWSPVWGGCCGVEVRTISQGTPLNNAEPPTYFSIDGGAYGTSGALQCLSGSPSVPCPPTSYYDSDSHWSNNGGAVAVAPSSGTPFLAITCAPVESDPNDHLCRGTSWDPGCWGCGAEPNLETYDLANGYTTGSLNWSPVAPAAVYFNNQIWFAMCAGYSCEGGITVGSAYPAQLTGCTYSAPDMYVPGSATTATGTIDAYGSNGGCIWGAFSGAGWPWPALAAHGNGSGTYSFSVTPNSSANEVEYSLTAADDQMVWVTQGTAGGSPGTGSVTIRYNPQRPGPSSGVVSVVVNGVTYSVSYSMPGETADQVAAGLVAEINDEPPDSAISASDSGSTVYITSNINGSNTNYSFSASQTYSGDGPSFSPVCSGSPSCSGLTLTGGTN